MFKKIYLMLAIATVFIMVLPMIMQPVTATIPTAPTGAGGNVNAAGLPGANTLVEDTLNGGGPATTDPAAEYDTASAELIQNAYDCLINFNGEQCGNTPGSQVSNEYLPALATQVTVGPPATLATVGPSASGVSPPYTNFTIYFTIRGMSQSGVGTVPFQTWSRADLGNLTWNQYYLTPQDVAYSFLRNLVHMYPFEGSYWLLTDALLLQDAIYPANVTSSFATYLEGAVQYNNTCCWFNIPNVNFAIGTQAIPYVSMFNPDGSWNTNFWTQAGQLSIDYPLNTFFQVWAQEWASIVSYDWTVNWLNPYLKANGYWDAGFNVSLTGDTMEWTFGPTTGGGDPANPSGVFASTDWSNWTCYSSPYPPIYDEVGVPGGVTCGTGPYILEIYNPAIGGSYTMTRFAQSWNWGGPASWPSPPYAPQPQDSPATKPQGWCDNFEVIQIATEAGAIANLATGTADFAPVPIYMSAPILPNGINGATIPGVQCNYPIPTLETESFFMNQAVVEAPGALYGTIYGPATEGQPGNLSVGGIPTNFFSDINVRKAFAYALNITFYIQQQFLGRAYEPYTCAPDGYPDINTAQTTYNINLTLAQQYMNAAWGGLLNTTGFTVDLIYNTGNAQREAMMENLATVINALGPGDGTPSQKFNAIPVGVVWMTELQAMTVLQLPTFMIGWLADYNMLYDFMVPYMESVGLYAMFTGYSNPTVDSLLHQVAYSNNAGLLQTDYYQLESIYFNDVPSVTLIVPIGTGFQRDWVMGNYYNPIYPGVYAMNKWKYNAIPGDVDHSGKVDMSDVIDVLKAFGSYFGQFGVGGGYWPLMQARWNFYCDVIGTPREEWTDRKVDMGDVVVTLSHFGQQDTPTGSPGGAPYWNGAWNETSGWYGGWKNMVPGWGD